jgi:hypothetical protein
VIEQPGYWGELEVGDYLRDKTGEVWKVTERDDSNRNHLMISNRAGRHVWVMQPVIHPITRIVPTMDEAVRTVREMLGGEVLHFNQ